jgi:hypothetical protein
LKLVEAHTGNVGICGDKHAAWSSVLTPLPSSLGIKFISASACLLILAKT